MRSTLTMTFNFNNHWHYCKWKWTVLTVHHQYSSVWQCLDNPVNALWILNRWQHLLVFTIVCMFGTTITFFYFEGSVFVLLFLLSQTNTCSKWKTLKYFLLRNHKRELLHLPVAFFIKIYCIFIPILEQMVNILLIKWRFYSTKQMNKY